MRRIGTWIVTVGLISALGSGCGGSSGSDPAVSGVVITHPEDFYIYFYDSSLHQLDGTLVADYIDYDIDDSWNHENQTEGNSATADYQSDSGGRIHVFWEIGRKGSTQDAQTYQDRLADGGLSCAFTLGVSDDQKTASYLPKKMNFGLSGQLSFANRGSVEMVLGQSGDGPWKQIEHQIKDAIKDSAYAAAFDGFDVDEDLETFEHVADVLEDVFGWENVWTVGLNGLTVGSTPYRAAMINWGGLDIPHCDNPHQALVAPLQENGVPTGNLILVTPRDCESDHEINVILWNFSLD